MRKFLENKGWEDYLIWTIIGIIILGLFLFIIGFLWKIPVDSTFSLVSGEKYSINKLLSDDSLSGLIYFNGGEINSTNLFTLMGSLDSGMFGYSMAALAISGFSFIMLGILLFVILLMIALTFELIIPKIKKRQEK